MAAFGQVPSVDCRISNVPHTKSHFAMPVYKTSAEWEAHKAHLRKQILSAAGLLPLPEKTPLNAKIFGRIERGDYSVEKVYLETMPGFYLGGNLYRPLGKSGKFPGVLSPHGHWLYGRLEHQPLISAPARAINLARQGHVVFAYDMVGINDTNQTPHKFEEPVQQLWSFGPFGLQLWDSIRALDFLESLPDVDRQRLAVTGESGGGTQTFTLAAVDDRISYDAPVNMVSGIMQGGCFCENAPGLRFDTSNLEIAAMMAPRPMLLVSATGDWTRNVPKEEFPAIRRIYELYGKADDIEVVQIDAPHNYNKESREAVYRFFGKHVLRAPDAGKFKEKSSHMEPLKDLLVFYGRAMPENALSYEGVFAQWKNTCRRQIESIRDAEAIRTGLLLALGAEWPAKVASRRDAQHLVLSREGKGDLVPGLWKEGSGIPLLVVHPDGATAASALIANEKRPVLAIDAFAAKRDQSLEHFLTFNRSDDANRVQDILTALAFLQSRYKGKIELQGIGKAGVWCLFAAAVAPADLKLTVDLKGFSGSDEDFLKQFFVPGIQRAGGMQAALRLTSKAR
jgi:dienelactone hydrolase